MPSWPPHFFVLNEHILTAVFHCDEVSFHLNGWFGVGFFCWFSFFSIFSHFFCKEKDLTPAKLVLLVPYYHHKVVPSFFNIWYSRYSSITGFNFQKFFFVYMYFISKIVEIMLYTWTMVVWGINILKCWHVQLQIKTLH